MPERLHSSNIPRGGNETILLVQDEHSVRGMSRAILTEFGDDVIVAENEQEAIASFDKSPDSIHMLATHVLMANNDEADPAKQILELKPGLPSLVMICYFGEYEFLDHMIDSYILHKPSHPVDLTHKVRRALDLQE